jgi:hypothetical protein
MADRTTMDDRSPMFNRIISIDWSGAGRESDRVNLRIAVWDARSGQCRIETPPATRSRSWRRSECRKWLADRLAERPRTLIAIDCGLGLPWGSDRALFGVSGWRATVEHLARAYEQAGTARAAAEHINADPRFAGHGPFRFDTSRNDYRFYLRHDVAYHRLSDLLAPQAISHWYLGSGGTVGFHTITGLAAVAHLLALRDAGRIDFTVWPQEPLGPHRHVLVESYPAIFPTPLDLGPCVGPDERDSWKVLLPLVEANRTGELPRWFALPAVTFGRVEGVSLEDQFRFEGLIFGLS